MYAGVEVQLHAFLTSALGGGEWLASRPGRFTFDVRLQVPIGQKAGWAAVPVNTTYF
jgi:hypothetical protein